MMYLIYMLSGALIFAAGIIFEKLSSDEGRYTEADVAGETEEELILSEQWRNLLEYEGNEQEDKYEDR